MSKIMELYKSQEVTRPALHRVKLPPATETYQPVAHCDLVDMVEDAVGEVGYKFGPQHHGLTHEKMRYFGLIELIGARHNEQFALQIGIRNALDKRFIWQIAIGVAVTVCTNLCFGGQWMGGGKHTPNVLDTVRPRIWDVIENLKTAERNQELRFECYQEVGLSDSAADHLILNLLRRGAINTQRVEKVVSEWDEPSYDFGGRTIWRMHNAVTECLKGTNIHEMPGRTIELQAECDEVAGFTPLAMAA